MELKNLVNLYWFPKIDQDHEVGSNNFGLEEHEVESNNDFGDYEANLLEQIEEELAWRSFFILMM